MKFPQANDINLLFKILLSSKNGLYVTDVILNFNLVAREAKYYLDALEFLELLEVKKRKYFLTMFGNNIIMLKEIDQSKAFQVFIENSEKIEILFNYIKENKNDELSNYIQERYSISGSTLTRRVQCIKSWYYQINSRREND